MSRPCADSFTKALMQRDDFRAIMAEMARPPAKAADVKAAVVNAAAAPRAAFAPTPLDQAGRLDEDRFLLELTVGVLENDLGNASEGGQEPLDALLARVKSRRRTHPDSPMLEAAEQAIRFQISRRLWRIGELAQAEREWQTTQTQARSNKVAEPSPYSDQKSNHSAIVGLYMERGLWEAASRWDERLKSPSPSVRASECFVSGLLALERGDATAFQQIVAEAVAQASKLGTFLAFNAVRTATLTPNSGVSPDQVVTIARSLGLDVRTPWSHTCLALALLRAGDEKGALAEVQPYAYQINGKATVALLHARAGRTEQARALACRAGTRRQ